MADSGKIIRPINKTQIAQRVQKLEQRRISVASIDEKQAVSVPVVVEPGWVHYLAAAGVGGLTGLGVASASSKKTSLRIVGAGVGAVAAPLILKLFWSGVKETNT